MTVGLMGVICEWGGSCIVRGGVTASVHVDGGIEAAG